MGCAATWSAGTHRKTQIDLQDGRTNDAQMQGDLEPPPTRSAGMDDLTAGSVVSSFCESEMPLVA